MASDIPVITSDLTSMPEAAGDAALIVDSFSSEDIFAFCAESSMMRRRWMNSYDSDASQ